MSLHVHNILADTQAEGPGHRFCIWVQGCNRHCPGCFATHTWDVADGQTMSVAEVIAGLSERAAQDPPLEGVTFLGGEPFLQADALARIARHAKELGLSIFCFTGFTLEELQAEKSPGVSELLSLVDVLADGPYVQELRDFSRPWVGSSNQRFHFLTERYEPESFLNTGNKVEVRFHPDGSVQVNGMAEF